MNHLTGQLKDFYHEKFDTKASDKKQKAKRGNMLMTAVKWVVVALGIRKVVQKLA